MEVQELLNDVYNGRIALPDFQRSFIWDPEDVRELLVSVLGDYFIGSLLLLEQLKNESYFALRLVEGAKEVNPSASLQSIVKILLDGQQRTSALFYALHEPSIALKNRKNPYRFYVDLQKALEKNWDDAVVAVNLGNKKRVSEIDKQPYIIPFSLLRNIGQLAVRFKEDAMMPQIISLAGDFMRRPINTVALRSDAEPERIAETFERINRTGEPLSTFELLTARMFKFKVKLRELYALSESKYEFLEVVLPDYVLKTMALLRGEEIRRKNMLELKPDNFEQDWNTSCEALKTAYERVTDIKNGYGVLDYKKWMPYTTMIVPLAGIINLIKNKKTESPKNYAKIDSWYWSSIFFNRYDEGVDGKSVDDYRTISGWCLDDSQVPEIIQKFEPDFVDIEIDSQTSATYRGVMNMLVLKGALDFKTGKPPQFAKDKIQDDHIFPKSLYNYNAIPNRTLISSNAEKWKAKPSEYFKEILNEHGTSEFGNIMKSHLIPEEGIKFLLEDKLEEFCTERKKAISKEIQERTTIQKA